ncbi:hypothetical protein X797_010493 [Metarhizium robertsii]|uniref:Uncharacterized protein n=1 Tax=Metarhizium robertsii TaxID=568076 RepID=A0A014P496_9HYPO|nr:hypothetical protein X797_010493 [Metarhizium robertsii]
MQVTTFLVTVFAGLCLATPVAQDHSSTSIFGLNDNCHPFFIRRWCELGIQEGSVKIELFI